MVLILLLRRDCCVSYSGTSKDRQSCGFLFMRYTGVQSFGRSHGSGWHDWNQVRLQPLHFGVYSIFPGLSACLGFPLLCGRIWKFCSLRLFPPGSICRKLCLPFLHCQKKADDLRLICTPGSRCRDIFLPLIRRARSFGYFSVGTIQEHRERISDSVQNELHSEPPDDLIT